MMAGPELIITSDGSHSLHSEAFQVAYHSVHGAIQESQHVFMQAGFQACLDRGLTSIRILEMGFGTGLNAYLALLKATEMPELSVSYLTIEQFPISAELVGQLNYPHQLGHPDDQRFANLHSCKWEAEVIITDNFTLRKIKGDLLSPELTLPLNWADTVFYDAFAPESQPQLWEEPALLKVKAAMAKGANLVTYCAKGVVKRRFKSLRMAVESLPGPPRKREMTRAIKEEI